MSSRTTADILNINPPVFNPKDYPNDPAMALKFDTPLLKKCISLRFVNEVMPAFRSCGDNMLGEKQ